MTGLGCCGRGGLSGLGANAVELPPLPGYVTEQQCDARTSAAAGEVASGARMLLAGVAVGALVIGYLVGKSRK